MGQNVTDGSNRHDYAAHLARSRRVWDRWSDHYALSESDFAPMREAAIDRLGLQPGDCVLDVGCGPGVNFERLRTEVGESGRVVGIDYSPGMVETARARIERNGWDNVAVCRADATTMAFDTGFDAAVATLSLSVMPDVAAAVEAIHDHLAPGSPCVVFDLRTVPSGPLRVFNPALSLFLRWFANWNSEGDVPGALSATFADCETVETYAAGTAYTVLCHRN